MKQVYIFDFFGVFCPDISFEWYRKNVPTYKNTLDKYLAYCAESDYGRLNKSEFIARIAALTNTPEAEVSVGIENEILVNADLVKLTRSLKQRGHIVVCLSNGNPEWTNYMIDYLHIDDLFKKVYVSSEIGILKPNPGAYEYVLGDLGISAADAYFIDDRPVNVEAAQALGMQGIVFTDTKKLARDLNL